MLELYFGEVPEEFRDDADYFTSSDGVAHYYKMEVEGDTVRVLDTVGRYMPFDIEDLQELADVFCAANDIVRAKEAAQEYFSDSVANIASLYGSLRVVSV